MPSTSDNTPAPQQIITTGKTSVLYVDIKEFTDNVQKENIEHTVSGDGIFDDLMETATKHIQVQFDGNRIRQEDYADAYVHIYEATLQAALKAWLEKGLTEYQANLLAAQTRHTDAETETETHRPALVDAQTEHTKAETVTESRRPALVDSQTALTLAQKKTEDKKPANIEAQTNLVLAQQATERRRPDNVDAQTELYHCQAKEACEKAELVKAQIDLARQQIEVEKEKLKLLQAQIDAEKAKANLYARQVEGYDELYKKDILKILMDAWNVGFSVAKDSFEASGIPATMQQKTINDLYNQYIVPDLDRYVYKRDPSIIKSGI